MKELDATEAEKEDASDSTEQTPTSKSTSVCYLRTSINDREYRLLSLPEILP